MLKEDDDSNDNTAIHYFDVMPTNLNKPAEVLLSINNKQSSETNNNDSMGA